MRTTAFSVHVVDGAPHLYQVAVAGTPASAFPSEPGSSRSHGQRAPDEPDTTAPTSPTAHVHPRTTWSGLIHEYQPRHGRPNRQAAPRTSVPHSNWSAMAFSKSLGKMLGHVQPA